MKKKAVEISRFTIEPMLNVEVPIYPIDILRREYIKNNLAYAESLIKIRLDLFLKGIQPIMKKGDRYLIDKIENYFSNDLLDKVETFLVQYLQAKRIDFSSVQDEISWLKNKRIRKKVKLEIEIVLLQLFRPYRMFQYIINNNAYKNDSYDQQIENNLFDQAVKLEKAFVPTKEKKFITWEATLIEACKFSPNKLYKTIKMDSREFDLLMGRFNSYKNKLNIYKS